MLWPFFAGFIFRPIFVTPQLHPWPWLRGWLLLAGDNGAAVGATVGAAGPGRCRGHRVAVRHGRVVLPERPLRRRRLPLPQRLVRRHLRPRLAQGISALWAKIVQ